MSTPAGTRPPQHDGGVEGTVRDFWASRPRRPRRGRKIAGVAAGIGNRYGIDPVIVRVALIVATIMGGIGPFVYLLGWLLLPEEGDEVSALESLIGRGRSSMPAPMTIGLCLALFPASGWAFGGMWFRGGGLFFLALAAGAVFLLHRSRGELNRPARYLRPATAAAPAAFRATPGEPGFDRQSEQDVEPRSGWDPLGADPMGWDLPSSAPEPRPVTPPARRHRSKVGPVTVGLALLTAGVGVALSIAEVPWFSAPHVIGMTLAVLGLGMVAGAFLGGGRGLVVLAVPLAAAGILLTAVPFGSFPGGGWGEIDETPRSLDELEKVYERTMGSVRLDLTALPPSDKPIEVAVRSGMGEATVIVPEDADVTYTCSTSMGDGDCLGEQLHEHGMNGMGDEVSGTSQGSGDQKITLDVSSRMGSVEVTRG